MNARKRLKRYRDENQMSVVELAKRVKCSPQFIYALECETPSPKAKPKAPGVPLAERIERLTGIPSVAWDRVCPVKHHRPIRLRRTA